jgi:hypothetical protein
VKPVAAMVVRTAEFISGLKRKEVGATSVDLEP